MPRKSNKGWKLIGVYTTRQSAERRANGLKARSKWIRTKITERYGKTWKNRRGKTVYHTLDHPSGKKTLLFRLWAK